MTKTSHTKMGERVVMMFTGKFINGPQTLKKKKLAYFFSEQGNYN